MPDGLFRMATLPAGLQLRPVGNHSASFFRTAAPDPDVPERARRELLRRFLRRCGPADAKDLAAWAGITPAAARSWWGPLAGELVEVRVDGKRLWLHGENLSTARESSIPTAVRLLPPYDPLSEVAHRELLLPDSALRRKAWRTVANPGSCSEPARHAVQQRNGLMTTVVRGRTRTRPPGRPATTYIDGTEGSSKLTAPPRSAPGQAIIAERGPSRSRSGAAAAPAGAPPAGRRQRERPLSKSSQDMSGRRARR